MVLRFSSWLRFPARLALSFGLLLAAVAVGPSASAQIPNPLDLPIFRPALAEGKPIVVAAEEAQGWTEDNFHVLLLKGNVVIEQGLTRLRCQQALMWIGQGADQPGKIVPAQIYAEGQVSLEKDGARQQADQLFVEWRTSGGLRLTSQQKLGQATPEDPFFRRGVEERGRFLSQPQPSNDDAAENDAAVGAVLTKRQSDAPGIDAPSSDAFGTRFDGQDFRSKRIQISPRGSSLFQSQTFSTGLNEQALVITGGVAIYIDDPVSGALVDISTDRAVLWIKDLDLGGGLGELRSRGISREQIELYLEGHVEIRQANTKGPQSGMTVLLLADAAYYDVGRNVALLNQSEIIVRQPGVPVPVHMRAQEIRQVNLNRFEASEAVFLASRLPSDPDLQVFARDVSIEAKQMERPGLFGRPALNPLGQPEMETRYIASAGGVVPELLGVPIGYLPRVEADMREPLGPLRSVRTRGDRIFGFGLQAGWDVFSILGSRRPDGTRWMLDTDFFSKRGPGLGTQFETAGVGLFGFPGRYNSSFTGYFMYDYGNTDILSRFREIPRGDGFRGRALLRHRQELDARWTLMAQVAYLSDRNFLEQYFKREFDDGQNQETFINLDYKSVNFGADLFAKPNIRDWVNETQYLPELKGHLIGQDFFNLFSYSARGAVGYYDTHQTSDNLLGFGNAPFDFSRAPLLPPSSDVPNYNDIQTGRFYLWQELELPLLLGPVKITPYGRLDMAYYTQTLTGDADGRLAGGGGARASLPFTRIDLDAYSQLFNVNGLAHKMSLEAEYRYMTSNLPFRQLPLLDRIDDDASDQARRDLRLYRLQANGQAVLGNPALQTYLATSPVFDPMLYILRRGIDGYEEIVDELQFLRMGVRNRWQTKRGLPGQEHTIDWMTLNVFGTYFPDQARDNFGHQMAFAEYDYTWHIGDRTTFVSQGWADPYGGGPRYLNLGMFVDRPERLSFYLGYRQIEPVGSRAIITSTSYAFSEKYQISWASSFDFGLGQNLGNALILSRAGTDLQINFGINYDALTNNFGVTLELIPILVPPRTVRQGGLIAGAGRTP